MIMRTAYWVIAYLLALSVAVQASLIAFGAFALENNIDNGPVSDGDTTGVTLHHSFAYVVVLFAVALLAVSFGAKVQHGVRWAAIPLGLVVVQFFLAYAAYSAAIVGVLHGSARGRAVGRGGGPGLTVRTDPRAAYLARPRDAMRAAAGQGCPDYPPSASCHPRRATTHRRLRIGLLVCSVLGHIGARAPVHGIALACHGG
jgi:hypothetical protein